MIRERTVYYWRCEPCGRSSPDFRSKEEAYRYGRSHDNEYRTSWRHAEPAPATSEEGADNGD